MVKRRESYSGMASNNQPTDKEIEAFAAAADSGGYLNEKDDPLSPTANRDYKSIRVPLNRYEYSKLEKIARNTGRTKLSVIRRAILKFPDCDD